MPYRLIAPLTRLYISIEPAKPLNLSLTTLRKKIVKEFKEHTPVDEISQNLELSIAGIYKIINQTRVVKIKIGGRYTSDIKKRFQEASRLKYSIKEITKIFHLKKSQAYYLNHHLGKKKPKEALLPYKTFTIKTLNPLVLYQITTHTTSTIHNNLGKA